MIDSKRYSENTQLKVLIEEFLKYNNNNNNNKKTINYNHNHNHNYYNNIHTPIYMYRKENH